MLLISSNFDSGAIDVVRAERADNIELRIRRDSHADIVQWFHFRLQGARATPCTMRFMNAGQSTYPGGWDNYRVVASYDREHWFRVPTSYAAGVMTVAHIPEHDSVYYAYFEPYSWERHLSMFARAQSSALVRLVTLGQSVQGRPIDMISASSGAVAKRKVWMIARQHPGETMAEWFIEGLVDALLDENNAMSRVALQHADFFIVPNMNPDGSVLGNLRTNAAGANLNREWMEPSAERSPEVFAVREAMLASGVDVFFDVHGDEALPYVFVAGSEMLPTFSEQQRLYQDAFVEDFKMAAPDFQDVHGYSVERYRVDALKLASKWVADRFRCLSLTLELPFKDNANLPRPEVGWNGERSRQLGRASLLPLVRHLQRLGQQAPV